MFFSPTTNTDSSAVASIQLNPTTNQVLVKYINSTKSYLYENVSFDAILDYLAGEYESVGKFVNAYCKGNMVTTIG
tara:strand:+ start:2339 stop:2566 length:228 start_codon:yes stop_codon:yes gene_type:complete